jgi:hypothetical protein
VLRALVLGFATAAILAPAAGARFVDELPDGYVPAVEAELALVGGSGGVTPTNLARAYEPRYEGVAKPDGYQPQLRGNEPLIIRDGPDGWVPNRGIETATVAAAGSSIDWDQVASGFALGILLAALAAVVLFMARRRMRVAHL